MTPVLSAAGVATGYGETAVVRDVNLEVHAGEVVALLGPNGSGKTTTLLALAGDLPVLEGDIVFQGSPTDAPLHRRARDGLSFVTEERSVFMGLTVAENLRVGRCDTTRALELFPELAPLRRRTAGLLSGGEQQMLTLARALTRSSRLLLADELSLGLAPLVVSRLLRAVRQAADEQGCAALLVEQHVDKALQVADRVYVMSQGAIVLQGTADELQADLGSLRDAYLTGAGEGR